MTKYNELKSSITSATGMIALRFHKTMTSEEKTLANWLRDQRRHIKKNSLHPNRIAYVYFKNWVSQKEKN